MKRSLGLLIVVACLAACAGERAVRESATYVPCEGGNRCLVGDAMRVSEQSLRKSGALLRVACEQRIDERVDGPYEIQCREQINALAVALSERFQGALEPISNESIEIDFEASDCVCGLDFGFCRFYGVAKLPIVWR